MILHTVQTDSGPKQIGMMSQEEAAETFNKKFRPYHLQVEASDDGKLNLTSDSLEYLDNHTGSNKKAALRANQGIIADLQRQIVAGGNDYAELTDKGVKKGFSHQTTKQLAGFGISGEMIDTVLKGYAKNYQPTAAEPLRVGIDNFLNTYAYTTSSAASAFNAEMQKLSPEEQEQYVQKFLENNKGFGTEAVPIKNIHMDSDRFIANDPLNFTTRAGVIDLGSQAPVRYVAVGYNNSSIMDNWDGNNGAVGRDAVRDELRSLQSQIKSNETLPTIESETNHRVQRPMDELLKEGYGKLEQAVRNSATAKEGAYAKATSGYMIGSGGFKAGILATDEAALRTSAVLNEARIDGHTIAEHALAGHRVNATFLSEKAIRNSMMVGDMSDALAAVMDLGKEKNLSEGEKLIHTTRAEAKGALEAGMGRYLDKFNENGGAVGVNLRYPSEYQTSMSGTHIFLDRTLNDNQMRTTDMTMVGQHGDMDGDITYAGMARGRVDIKGKTFYLNQLQIHGLRSFAKENGIELNIKPPEVFDEYAASADYIGSTALSGAANKAIDNGKSFANGEIEQMVRNADLTTNIDVGGLIFNTGGLSRQQRIQNEDMFRNIVLNQVSDKETANLSAEETQKLIQTRQAQHEALLGAISDFNQANPGKEATLEDFQAFFGSSEEGNADTAIKALQGG